MSEQMPLFQDEYVLLNDAVGALVALSLDSAVTAFQNYRDLYRGNEELDGMITISALLRQGLTDCPETGPDRPGRLFAFWRSFENSPEAKKPGCEGIISRIRVSFFHLLVQAIEAVPLHDSSYLSSPCSPLICGASSAEPICPPEKTITRTAVHYFPRPSRCRLRGPGLDPSGRWLRRPPPSGGRRNRPQSHHHRGFAARRRRRPVRPERLI